MRKALIGLILAATAATPVAALAQEEGTSDRYERIRQRQEQRQEQRQQSRSEQREARPEARIEQRQERVERRQERVEARQTPQVQAQPDPQVRAFDRRGERNLRNSGGGGDVGTEPTQQRREWRRDRRGDNDGGSIYPQAWQGDPNDPRLEHYRRLERQNQRSGDGDGWRDGRRDDRRDWRQDRRGDRRDWRRDWNRTSWRSDRRYDWSSWRFRNRSLFRLSPYYSPYRHHRYSRFSIGLFLEPSFYSQRYWIGDPWQYRLPYAPPGTQWVRYYNDVLLVDVYSGEVIDVIYDFFW